MLGGFVLRILTFLIGATLPLSLVSTASAATNEDVNPQVTDSVTQTNVKVIGEAPAVSTGTLYVTTAQSLQIMNQANASPQAVMHAITVEQPEVAALVSSQRSRPIDKVMDDIDQHLDAIHDRLRECGPTCIMNIQVHGLGPSSTDRRDAADILTEWIIDEEIERLRPDELATISYVGDGDTGLPRYRSPLSIPTSVDFLVQDVGADLRGQIASML